MEIILCLIKTIIGYFILLFLSTNLLGMVVRGFFDFPSKNEIESYNPILKKFAVSSKRTSIFVTILFTIIMIVFYYLLFYFWNIGVAIVAALLMIARLPDLLYEIRTGIKVTSKTGPKGVLNNIMLIIDWGALIVLWFALC